MKKIKDKKTLRTLILSITSITLASALFLGVNHLVFAAETSKTDVLDPSIELDDEETTENNAGDTASDTDPDVADEHQEEAEQTDHMDTTSDNDTRFTRSLTVYEFVDEIDPESLAELAEQGVYGAELTPAPEKKALAIPYEEAAQLGAQYIYELFDVDIDGTVIEMWYEESDVTGRTYWTGTVGETEADMDKDNGSFIFMFKVDAITGEGREAYRTLELAFRDEEEQAKQPYLGDSEEDIDKYVEISREYEHKRRAYALELYNADPDSYKNIAKEFAQKHFRNSEAVDALLLVDRTYDSPVFLVTDHTGHQIEIAIHPATKALEMVSDTVDESEHIDHVYDPDAVG